jgi:radical SAM protein with 4Fe4S-binding SPASM domain
MGFDVFRKIIDEQVTANPKYTGEVWLHHFGESTQHPQFSEMMAYASSKGVNAGLSVNPVMLTPSVGRALLEAKPRVLTISLDGHDDASFEKIRGLPNIYEKSKQRLLEFLALKREMGSSTHIRLSMINFSLNGDSIGKLADEWRSTPGIDEFCAKPFAVWDGSVAAVNAFSNRKFEKRKKVTCEFPFTKMSIAWNGNVVPCCNDYNEKYVLGNVTEQPLSEIWNGEPMRRLRREFLDNKVSNNLCRKCPFLYHTPGEVDSTFI